MANCLITKLDAVVNNDSLKKLGTLYINATNSGYLAGAVIGISTSSARKITGVSSDLYNQSGVSLGREITEQAGAGTSWFVSGGGVVEVYNKYDLTYLNVKSSFTDPINTKDLSFCTALTSLTAQLAGKLSELPNAPSLTRLDLVPSGLNNGLEGSLADLPTYPSLTYIDLDKYRLITGELKALGGFVALTTLRLGDLTRVGGSVEDFVNAQRAAGRTTCSGITCPYIGTTGITFNGSSIAVASNTVISWTATTITCAGVTIDG